MTRDGQPSRLRKHSKAHELRLKLYVRRFVASEAFYRDVLAYPVIERWDRGEGDRGVLFDTGSGVVELLDAGDDHVPIQGADLSLRVTDLDRLWRHLRQRAEVVHPPRHNPWGDTSFTIADPEGFRLTFFTPDAHDTPEPDPEPGSEEE